MKPARMIVIGVAAVAAIGAALIVRAVASPSGEPAAPAAAAAPAAPMAQVLVAARDLEPGRRLAQGDLEWKPWPVDQVNPAFITDGSVPIPAVQAAEAAATEAGGREAGGAVASVARTATNVITGGSESEFYGSVVREQILAGEPVLPRKIVRAGDSGYLAAYLEPGMRAMSISVNVETAAGGFILPGDRVDVVLTRENQAASTGQEGMNASRYTSATVLQNVKILAIDQSTRANDEAQAVIGATATLELAPRDAEALALARSEGDLSLVLRSYADTSGPSGRVNVPNPATAVRVYRGGAPDVVVVQ